MSKFLYASFLVASQALIFGRFFFHTSGM